MKDISIVEELKNRIKDLEQEVNDLRRIDEALQASEANYRLLIKNLPCVVYKGFKDFSAEFYDKKIELFTGYNMNEFNSGKLKWVDIIHKDDLADARERFINALKTDRSYVREYRILTKSGDIHWIQERGQIVCDRNGEIEYVSGVFFDITDRKKTEAEREKLIFEIRDALTKVKMLSGMLPICTACKKIRDDKGYWNQIESYIRDHSEAEFSHSICPECVKNLYPDLNDETKE